MNTIGLSTLFSICFQLTCLADGPVVEGDLKLVQVLLDAQQANLSRFDSGDLRATYRAWGRDAPTTSINVRLIWSGEKAYWDFDLDGRDRQEAPSKTRLIPVYGRMIFDGMEYTKYVTPEVQIFSQADFPKLVALHYYIDLRPSVRWTTVSRSTRTWAELLGPHPKFPSDNIEKWVIQQKGDEVIIERHDRFKDGSTGLSRRVASLALAGNVVATTYRSKNEESDYNYTWRKDPQGRVILERERSREKHGDKKPSEAELVVTDFHVQPYIAPSQFELSALKIPKGAIVEDKIRNRRYTFDGRKVDQKTLDSLSKEAGTKGKEKGQE